MLNIALIIVIIYNLCEYENQKQKVYMYKSSYKRSLSVGGVRISHDTLVDNITQENYSFLSNQKNDVNKLYLGR
jgi:hypothetical protein